MNEFGNKQSADNSRSAANNLPRNNTPLPTSEFIDNRPEALTQRKIQSMMANTIQQNSLPPSHLPMQKSSVEEEELLQGKLESSSEVVQRALNSEAPIQRDDDDTEDGVVESSLTATDIISSAGDILSGTGEIVGTGLTTLASSRGDGTFIKSVTGALGEAGNYVAEGADAVGDFTGDIATTPENASNAGKAIIVAYQQGLKKGAADNPLVMVEGVTSMAALASSLDTYGTILNASSYTAGVAASTMVSVGSWFSQWNPVIGFVGSAAKTLRGLESAYESIDFLNRAASLEKSDTASGPLKKAAEKLREVAGEKMNGGLWDASLNAVDTFSNLGGPIAKGAIQVATKSAGSSWGSWITRGLAQTNSFTAQHISSYQVAKEAADAAEEAFNNELLALAQEVITTGATADIIELNALAKELGKTAFSDELKKEADKLADPVKKAALQGL